MSPRRPIAAADRALKSLLRALIDRCGGFDAAATCVRVSRSQLHNYTAMDSDNFAPVDVVAALEAVAGEPLVTAELARRADHALVPLDLQGEGEIPCSIAAFGREVSEVFASYAGGMADGVLTDEEAADLERKLLDVKRVSDLSIAALRRRKAGRAK